MWKIQINHKQIPNVFQTYNAILLTISVQIDEQSIAIWVKYKGLKEGNKSNPLKSMAL
jgi:hypothetical protein